MHLGDSFGSSLSSIWSHKLRSFLTLVGIMIGVAAVVTMFSSVSGIKLLIMKRMEAMGWDRSIVIYPSSGENQNHRRRGRFMYMNRRARPLSYNDYLTLKKEIDHKHMYGRIDQWQQFQDGESREWVRLTATNNDFFLNKTYPLRDGRYFSTFEDKTNARVCVIGHFFAEKYFSKENPIDKTITIGGNRYRIIGVLSHDILNNGKAQMNPWDRRWDLKAVYIPLSTGSQLLRQHRALDNIYVQARKDQDYNLMKTHVFQTILASHSMAHDFAFDDVGSFMAKITTEINQFMKTWNITLSAIASISLLVGGIGLFSTLLISINEKMLEIGIRKSVGAKELDIFSYFIIEALTLSLLGTFVGITFSMMLVRQVGKPMGFTLPMPIEGILLGIGFAIFIGFVSGLYPAIKAAKVDPIRAIFYFE